MIRVFLILLLLVVLTILFIRIPENRREVSTWSDYYARQNATRDKQLLEQYEKEGKILIIK